MPTCLTKNHIVGESPAMLSLAQWVETAARQWDTILITGERGTGKELLAKAIHKLGPTPPNKLPVIVDCASLHSSTAESVLFGHERGAFTGAVNKHTGLLEAANGTSLILDEISQLTLELQSRFLRFLEEGTVRRIGATNSQSIRARIIAATNRNLEEDVRRGLFLPDLYDRLNVLHVECPPLRERGEDVFELMKGFLKQGVLSRLDNEARQLLLEYPFPGNVRELRNLCRRLMIFHPGEPLTAELISNHLNPVRLSFKADASYCLPVNPAQSEATHA